MSKFVTDLAYIDIGIDIEVASTYRQRMRGVIGKKNWKGALLIKPVYLGIHTFGVGFDLDVAFLDAKLRVCKIRRSLAPNRFAGSWRCRAVLEAPAGSFEKWGVEIGTRF